LERVTVTPTYGVRHVATPSLQFWSEVHPFLFAMLYSGLFPITYFGA